MDPVDFALRALQYRPSASGDHALALRSKTIGLIETQADSMERMSGDVQTGDGESHREFRFSPATFARDMMISCDL